MTDDADQEREDLLALLGSPGWRRLLGHVQQTWGAEAYGRRVEAIVDRQYKVGTPIADSVEALTEAKRSIEIVLRWPQDRLTLLTRPAVSEEPYADHRRA